MFRVILFAVLALASATAQAIEPFELPDIHNRAVHVGTANSDNAKLDTESKSDSEPAAQSSGITVVCFLGTECPLAKLYAPRLNRLADEFPTVAFYAINSNRQDSLDEVKTYAETHAFSFPVLKDYGNQVADQFAAQRTPEVFVLDQQMEVRYRGRIDDQCQPGLSKQAADKHELREAIVCLLAGKEVAVPETIAVGCLIGRVREPIADTRVNYCDQISRLLQKHCLECHRDGEIGPFSLEDYDEVVGWADTMLEVVEDGRMPPWHANPEHGEFLNARNMPQEDKDALRKWVEAGMPYGNPDDLPGPLEVTEGWRLPHAPDLVVSMSQREFVVPADGTVEYQYFVVDPGFEDDKWITGAQIVPGNPRVVHHSIVFVRPPDGSQFRGIGWLTAYVPGTRAGAFPTGHAIKVPAKSKLVFQQHYTPNGTEQSDMTTLGLTFGQDEEITHEVYTLVGIDQEFEIPPKAQNHVVRGKVDYLPRHATLRSIMPHMHLRGKSFRLFAQQEGSDSILLDVPHYDFNWQHAYRLAEPLPLQELDELRFEVAFDNSEHNPVNPDPDEYVTWGDQTWEEMAVAFFEVSEPREKTPTTNQPRAQRSAGAKESPELSKQQQLQVKTQVDRILNRFDKDKDGEVAYEEASLVFRRFAFWEIDQNRDRRLSREEIEAVARSRVR